MKTLPSSLRCYIRPEKRHFLAICIDLNLIVRANSPELAREELKKAIISYLGSVGENNIRDLLPRPAPLFIKVDYYFACFKQMLQVAKKRILPL